MRDIYYKLLLYSNTSVTTRLLRILPASFLRPRISCTLEVVTLDDSMLYSAVSYVWGTSSVTKCILVNGIALKIGLNLWNFLAQMRSDGYKGHLWVDAISINQMDLSERSHQVAIMGQIYSKAMHVYIWLGCGSATTAELIQDLNGFDWLSLERFPASDDTTDPEYSAKRKQRAESYISVLKKILQLAALEYWSRLWIVQEFILAAEVNVLYGATTLRSNIFSFWLPEILARVANQDQHFTDENCTAYVELGRLLSRFVEVQFGNLIIQRHFHRVPNNLTIAGLPTLVAAYHTSKCSEVRDHVYALLPLVHLPHGQTGIIPDYTKATSAIFEEVTNLIPKDAMVKEKSLRKSLQYAINIHKALGLSDKDPTVVRVLKELADAVARQAHDTSIPPQTLQNSE